MNTTALLDALVVIIVFALTLALANLAALPAAGSWAVLAGLVAGAWRMRRAGLGLAALRLGALDRPAARLGLEVLGIALVAWLAVALAVGTLGRAFDWPAQDLSRFDAARGDLLRLAGYLLLAWVSAALGEELLFRGVLMNRLATALGQRHRWLAVPLQAALFGVSHAYLGARGVAAAAVIGLVFGAAWLRNGGRLLPLVVAHGLIDTVSLSAIAAGSTG